jgi:ribosomal protein L7/L12
MEDHQESRFEAIAEMRRQGMNVTEAIKEVRFRFSINLREAKDAVEAHPAWFPVKPPAPNPDAASESN